MALVAIAERCIVPGRAAAYLAALRTISQTLAFVDGRGEVCAVVDERDPDRVLTFGRWASRADHDGAMARRPTALLAEAESHVASRVGPLRWYRVVREIERVAVRASYVVVRRYKIPSESWAAFEAWGVALMRELVELPGVVSQALLVDLEDPSRVLTLVQYTSAEVAAAVRRQVASRPRPPKLRGITAERFAGRTDLLWEPPPVEEPSRGLRAPPSTSPTVSGARSRSANKSSPGSEPRV